MTLDPTDVRILLDAVAPKCFNCWRPATRYQGSPYTEVMMQEYSCDEHERPNTRYSDMPAASVIRRVMAAMNDDEAAVCPRISLGDT